MKQLGDIHNMSILSNNEITDQLQHLGWAKIIEAVAETFIEEAHGRVVSPAKTIIDFPETNSDFRVMPSYMQKYPDFCGVKIIGACTDNPKKFDLPLAIGIYILNDKTTQRPLLMFDAMITTAWRTAAATAVSVRELSSPDAATLGIIGCGMQAKYHIEAIKTIRNITKVMVFDLSEERMDTLLTHRQELADFVKSTKQNILDEADIVVTMTPTTKPHILTNNIQQRPMLLCAVGGDAQKKMEFEPSILTLADHFCDSFDQVAHTGTVHTALHDGVITTNDLKSLGNLMVGKQQLDSSKPVKMFLSTGVALEDLVMARLLYTQK